MFLARGAARGVARGVLHRCVSQATPRLTSFAPPSVSQSTLSPSQVLRRTTGLTTQPRSMSSLFEGPSQAGVEHHEQNITEELALLGHDKWGWVIYRTTYGDDDAWNRFKKKVEERLREQIADSTCPQLVDSMAWTFVSDRETLDGASRQQLRERFRAWAKQAIQTENPRAKGDQSPGIGKGVTSRYTYFVQVDEEALRSMEETDPDDSYDLGWVNLVDSQWEPCPEDDDAESGYEPIDGYFGEDVGWMMISEDLVAPWFYDDLGTMSEYWYISYVRPPDVCYH